MKKTLWRKNASTAMLAMSAALLLWGCGSSENAVSMSTVAPSSTAGSASEQETSTEASSSAEESTESAASEETEAEKDGTAESGKEGEEASSASEEEESTAEEDSTAETSETEAESSTMELALPETVSTEAITVPDGDAIEPATAAETNPAESENQTESEARESSSASESGVTAETEAADAGTATAEAAEPEEAAQGEGNGEENAAGPAPSAIFDRLSGSTSLPDLFPMTDNYISNYLGLDLGQVDGYVFEITEDPTAADTVIIMRAKDAGGVASIQKALENYKNQKEQELDNYAPEGYQVAASGRLGSKGNYVYLVMLPNAAEAVQLIEQSIG